MGAATTESINGAVQTVSSVYGGWRWRLGFSHMRKQELRRYRGLVTALHGGANAVRVPFCDWDDMSFSDAGTTITLAEANSGLTWSNGETWSNGQNWGLTKPVVSVSAATAINGSTVTIDKRVLGSRTRNRGLVGLFPRSPWALCRN